MYMAQSMFRYQVYFSILCVMCSAIGMFAIVRRILIGFDGVVWTAFGMMFVLAWAAIRIMRRQPMIDDAIFRLNSAPAWQELAPLRRYSLMMLDWPLFLAIREREVARLFDEPLTRLVFAARGIALVPVEVQHTAPYFLNAIARVAEGRGLKVCNDVQGVFGPRLIGPKQVELDLSGVDDRICNSLRSEFKDGALTSLRHFNKTLEAGYLSTLSETERNRYFMDNR